MLNASQIATLIPDKGSLVLCFTRTKDGQITVVVDPRHPKSEGNKENETLQAALSPKTVTGTPDMLDADFLTYLSKSIAAATNLKTQIENIDKEVQATLDKAKAEASKKVAEASKTKAKPGTSAAKPVTKPAVTSSPTQAVLGEGKEDGDESEGEETETEPTAEIKKEEVKPEVKAPAPALALF